MDHTDYRHLLIERRDKVLHVTLDTPDKLNAIGFEMESELLRLFQDLRRDRDTAVIVLTGVGRAFCAGANLASRAAQDVTGENFVAMAMQHINEPAPLVSQRRPGIPPRLERESYGYSASVAV